MELSPHQFAELVHHLKGSARFGGPADPRRAARVERQSRIEIVPIEDGRARPAVPVLVKNVSSRGLGFVRDRRMEPRSEFILSLARAGEAAMEFTCTVVRCEAVGEGAYSIGAEFADAAATPAVVAVAGVSAA